MKMERIHIFLNLILRTRFIFLTFFLLQISVVPAFASLTTVFQGHHTGISEIYTYDEIENSSWVEVRARQVFSKNETGSRYEVLAEVAIVSAKTSIQAANGLKITGFTGHGVIRAIGSAGRMGVKPNAILDALKNPLKVNNVVTDQLGRQSQRFIGQFGEVVVNPQTGRIISVNPTSSSKAVKPLKQLGL